jgi:hypothetical protein
MYKIRIEGKATTETKDLKSCDGIDCQDNFSEYMNNDESCNEAISGGYMEFELIDGVLTTVTEYDSTRKLTDDELHDVGEYTQGQWSDGIGEGFEQFECGEDKWGEEIYISAWCPGQVLKISQEKLG